MHKNGNNILPEIEDIVWKKVSLCKHPRQSWEGRFDDSYFSLTEWKHTAGQMAKYATCIKGLGLFLPALKGKTINFKHRTFLLQFLCFFLCTKVVMVWCLLAPRRTCLGADRQTDSCQLLGHVSEGPWWHSAQGWQSPGRSLTASHNNLQSCYLKISIAHLVENLTLSKKENWKTEIPLYFLSVTEYRW